MNHEIVVIKYGGSLLKHKLLRTNFFKYIKQLQRQGNAVLLVHGGGAEITKMLARLKIVTRFVQGLRYTSPAVMEIAEMVLSGKVNKQLVSELNHVGIPAVGISGRDCHLVTAVADKKFGLVGKPKKVCTMLITVLLKSHILPVVSPIGVDVRGNALNLNADTLAAELAVALHAKKLVFLTDVPGVLDKSGKVVHTIKVSKVHDLITCGIVTGGMIPKIKSCENTVNRGVSEVVITNNCWDKKSVGTKVV